MAGPWEQYAVAEPPAAEPPPWEQYQARAESMPAIDPAAMAGAPSYQDVRDHLEPVAEAFGQGFREGWGPERWGLSAESTKQLADAGIFAKGAQYDNPLQAANELFYEVLARTGQLITRGTSGVYRGLQAAGTEVGLHRDIVSIPDAFMGSPHPTGIPLPGRVPRPFEDVVPREPFNAGSSEFRQWFGESKVVDEQGAPRTVFHGTAVRGGAEFTEFDRSKLGSATEAPSAREAFFFAEDRNLAESYAQGTNPYEEFGPVRWLNKITLGGYEKFNEGIVSIFGTSAKQEGKVVAAHLSISDPLIVDMGGREVREQSFFETIRKAKEEGRDGVLFKNAIDPGFIEGKGEAPTNVWAAFEPSQIKIVSFENAEGLRAEPPMPAKPAVDIVQARELGIVGPERPPVTEGAPQEAATRTVAADRTGDDVLRGAVPPDANPWQQRFDQFVSKLEAPDDVKQLIREAAAENGDFLPARQGDIPLSHVEDIAQAAGVEPGEINQRGLGRTLRNDAEVRTAMQLMLQVTDNVKSAARDLKAADTPENLIALQEAIMRRDLAVEQVVGLRAEWGRTGNVFQEFLRNVKDQEGLSDFLKGKGRSPDDLRGIARAIDNLDGAQAAKFLNDARSPTFWDKAIWYWVNALISGPVTHAKYVIANAAFGAYEGALVTPMAASIGMVRRLTGSAEGVYLGEAPARLWGLIAGTPDAAVAAWRAARTGLQTPLPSEVAQNIIPRQNKNIAFQQKPIDGAIGTVVGLPSRMASGIHSFFNFLGHRAEIEAQSYRMAAKEGLKPTEDNFWQRRQELADNPTKEMMDHAIENGYKLTFITELGPSAKAFQQWVNKFPPARLVMPFVHIPANILKAAYENTPAAFLDPAMRADLTGKNGTVKQDTAVARIVVGSALGAWMVNQVMNDRATGYGPTDPKERAQWLATGHQPYSVRIGDYWVSYNRFGPLGTLFGLHANMAEVLPHLKWDSEEVTKAAGALVKTTGRLVEDEVGMQGLANLIEAVNDPDRKGARFTSSFVGSWLPYSSALRQTASFMDPQMREAKTFIDGLRYQIPVMRQNLLPKRDWTGEPLANTGYETLIRMGRVSTDPVALEMRTLDLHPAPPQNRIGGIKLTPELYDRYQSVAGPLTKSMLDMLVSQPGWYDLPPYVREEAFKAAIRSTRQSAAAMIQAESPRIIQQALDDMTARINGGKATKKLKD